MVRFLIEGDSGTVLYTGDFRLEKEDLCNMKDLHSGNGSVCEILTDIIINKGKI